ncbi:MAG: ATP-binding protein [Myxococcota bacterium]
MTPLLYFVVAVIAASLATRAYLADPDDSARRAFLGLGWAVAISYAAFSVSLLPGLQAFRVLYMLAGCFVPAMALWTFDRIFEDQVSRTPARLVLVATIIVAPLLTLVHAVAFYDVPRASPPEVIAGVLAFGSFGLALSRLWAAHNATTLAVERVRLRYLVGVTAAAVLLTLAEHLARNLGTPVDPTGMTLGARVVALQGAIPPFSAFFTGIALYLLHHTLVLSRLLDLHELFSRMAALLLSALMLVLIDGLTFLWVDAFSTYPFHSTFQIFLASLMFLAAYEPMRPYIAWASSRLFNQRGQRLQDTLGNLAQTLPTVISKGGLAEMLLSKLHASGRVPVCSVYLWDPRIGAFSCLSHRGHESQRPLKMVASGPFTEKLVADSPWHARATVARKARTDERFAEVLSLMDTMKADLVMPFVKSGIVLGWINLRDEAWSDGYSADEILKLEEVADLGTVVLSNIRDFQELQERDRLAALGAMAAGLAHEIRNPLAGLKGAAQYLQAESLDTDANDMLNVIIEEANRLDVVVRQFLDYARPFELDLRAEHLNAIVTHVLTLMRASRLPEGIELRSELAGDLPMMHFDSTRMSQVLLNLLQNAVQAMPDGGLLTVETRKTRDRHGESVAEVAVRDTGCGIDEETMEQLFIPFFTTKESGTGLGLPICQRIVQAHGGDLDVQSVEDLGATFIVRLPLPEVTEERPAEEAAK